MCVDGKVIGIMVSSTGKSTRENEPFLAQAEPFLDYFTRKYAAAPPDRSFRSSPLSARPLEPVIINDLMALTNEERQALRDQYYSEQAVATFVTRHLPNRDAGGTSLLALAEQLKDSLELSYPIAHPKEMEMESDSSIALRLPGVKIYDHGRGHTFATSNNKDFVLHQDGLGSAGSVRTVILYMESPPLAGGYNCFQNLARAALNLAAVDKEAYRALFLPDAITIIRPTGNRALKVTGPVFYLDEEGRGKVNFVGVSPARPVGDYEVHWSSDPDARRGLEYMLRCCVHFGPGSTFCQMSRASSGVIFDNTCLTHGRTAFWDSTQIGAQRIVWRKWFASNQEASVYRHAPGIRMTPELSSLRPDLFDTQLLHGEWRYLSSEDRNVRIQ
jgi:alpha-ketoglutarate-dependent taurine dioxygenase